MELLLVGVVGPLVAVLCSLLVANQLNRARAKEKAVETAARREEKEADWARQDEVAARVEATAAQAKEAAQLLVESNASVAAEVHTAAHLQGLRLDQIHALVNSNVSNEKEKTLVFARAVASLTRLHHDPDKPESVLALEMIDAEVRRQVEDLEQRDLVTRLAEEQRAAGTP